MFIGCDYTEKARRLLATEVLGLTKTSWNDTQVEGGGPITLAVAYRVRPTFRYVDAGVTLETAYRLYTKLPMPRTPRGGPRALRLLRR